MRTLVISLCALVTVTSCCTLLAPLQPCRIAAKFQAQQARQAEGGEQLGTGSPRLNAQQRLSSMGGAAVSAAAPSDVTGICGTGYYISVSNAPGCVYITHEVCHDLCMYVAMYVCC
jgi:hypothetical protein